MIAVVAFFINLLAPIVNVVGIIGLCGMGAQGDWGHMIWCVVLFVVGIIFGVKAYNLDIAPRWLWSKSFNELFKYSVFRVMGYGWNFAMWPSAIYFIKTLVTSI